MHIDEPSRRAQTADLHLKSRDCALPWQAYRAGFVAGADWQEIRVPFKRFDPYRLSAPLDAERSHSSAWSPSGRRFVPSSACRMTQLIHLRQKLRVVLDTNLVLSALVFGGGTPGVLRVAWQASRFQPLVSTPTVAKLLRVLEDPKFKLSSAGREELLADYLPWCETVKIPNAPPAAPTSRDPCDQLFLQLTIAGKAQFLITGEADLLDVAEAFSQPIVTAAQCLEILDRMK